MTKAASKLFVIFAVLAPLMASAQSFCDTDNTLCNPTGSVSFEVFFKSNIVGAIVALLGIAAIIMVVYSGIRMVISQGDSEQVAKAKTSLKWTLAGTLLVILAFTIVSAVSQFFGGRTEQIDPNDPTAVQNPISATSFQGLAGTLFTSVAAIIAMLSIMFIIINAFRYITAQGNEEQTEMAKQGLQWSVIGLVIVLLAYVIVSAALKLFNSNL